MAPDSTASLFVVVEDERLVCVMGFGRQLLLAATPGSFQAGKTGQVFDGKEATLLHVVALSREDQGRRVGNGQRLSSLVMETLLAEAIGGRQSALVTAIVARENLRSIALCERHGLRSQTEYNAAYLRLSAHFEKRDS
jgi:ribosomal protein S18 acetylase RimI-like enzyme